MKMNIKEEKGYKRSRRKAQNPLNFSPRKRELTGSEGTVEEDMKAKDI